MKIIKELGAIRCPDTNEKVVGRVWRKEDVYSGEELSRAPDIIFEWKDHAYVHRPTEPGASSGFLKKLSHEEMEKSENLIRPSGIHRDYGILIGLGAHIKQGEALSEASIMDLAPTILYRSGIPAPSDMDGRVCLSFEKDFADKTVSDRPRPIVKLFLRIKRLLTAVMNQKHRGTVAGIRVY